MADIFLSYTREDRNRAKALAKIFEKRGWSVWFDASIGPGETLDELIERELSQARCVVVLWSKTSVVSRWIRVEAQMAEQRAILIPVLIDDVQPPLAFRFIQAADLTAWRGTGPHPQLDVLLKAIEVVFLGAVEITQRARSDVAVGAYLQSLTGGRDDLKEVKLLFVGDGGAGKTSLLKQITGNTFNPHEVQTHGINIEQYMITYEAEDIKVRAWDFGGQAIMHSMHQFFLSKRSLYILVLDGRKDEDPEYWLQHISALGANPPILVVLNKIDEHPSFELNRKFLREKYRTIQGFFRLSCSTKEGIKEFGNALRHHIRTLEHLRSAWPSHWYKVKSRIEGLTKDYISYDSFEEICQSEGICEIDAIDTLADLLHDLGVVLHFNNAVLRETNVINPTWITAAVYDILNAPILLRKHGVLNRADLKTILNPSRYPERKHDYIVNLMEKFELCISLKNDYILIPDLLPVEEPEFSFAFGTALKCEIVYDFLPKSIIPRFIVHMYSDVQEQLLWRSGVVLNNQAFGVRSVIRADYKQSIIYIFVNGNDRREYFSIIRKAFLDINAAFPRVICKEMVPCICHECMISRRPYFYDYQYLLHRRRKGKTSVDCELSVEEVSLSALFAGIEAPDAQPYEGWDIFISYATNDVATVERVIGDLKKRGVTCWWDYEQISPGDSITRQIELGLRKSRLIVLCISRNQIESGWCRAEYASSLHGLLSGKASQKIVPFIIDDLPDEDVPLLLRDFRSERLSDHRGYERLLNFVSAR